jgi:hypothetical protein
MYEGEQLFRNSRPRVAPVHHPLVINELIIDFHHILAPFASRVRPHLALSPAISTSRSCFLPCKAIAFPPCRPKLPYCLYYSYLALFIPFLHLCLAQLACFPTFSSCAAFSLFFSSISIVYPSRFHYLLGHFSCLFTTRCKRSSSSVPCKPGRRSIFGNIS